MQKQKQTSSQQSIGFNIPYPPESCTGDRQCPFHGGERNIRGRSFVGKVIRAKVQKTAIIEFEGKKYVPKYERYLRTRTRLMVHNPLCIRAREGDVVQVYETRKISKRKNFVIVRKLNP